MKLTKGQIEKAVNYWAGALINPSFKTLNDRERKDPGSQPAAKAEVLAALSHEPPEKDKIEKFKTILRTALKKPLRDPFCLSVDYEPSFLLAEIARKAGIEADIITFPWKTVMHFEEDGKVFLAEGYGLEFVEI